MSAEKSSLYVDVFSNASLDLYPNNKVSQFTVKLNQPLQLGDGSYEVGLAQLICPPTASAKSEETEPITLYLSCQPETTEQKTVGVPSKKAFPFGENHGDIYRKAIIRKPVEELPMNIYQPSNGMASADEYTFRYTLRLSDFDSPDELVVFLRQIFKGEPLTDATKEAGLDETQKKENAVVRDLLKRRVYENNHAKVVHEGRIQNAFGIYQDDKQRLTFKVRDYDTRLAIPSPLARLFGLSVADGQLVLYNSPGIYRVNTSWGGQGGGFDAARPSVMAVYSNLILSHRVGDTSAPLLRVLTLPQSDSGKPGEFLHFEFQDVHYLPVALKFIQDVHMELRGNDGQLIPFEGGITFIRLHFRRRPQ